MTTVWQPDLSYRDPLRFPGASLDPFAMQQQSDPLAPPMSWQDLQHQYGQGPYPQSLLGPILLAGRGNNVTMPWMPGGPGANGTQTSEGQNTVGGLTSPAMGQMGTIGMDANNQSVAATPANFGRAVSGFASAFNPVSMAMNAYQTQRGIQPVTARFASRVAQMLGLEDDSSTAANTQTGIDIGMNMGQLAPDAANAVADSISAASVAPSNNDVTGLGLGVDSSNTGGGGGGGGSKVICGHLKDWGWLEDDLYRAAHDGYPIPADVKRGYLLWAVPVVRVLKRHPSLNCFIAPLCHAWSAAVAHERFPATFPRHLPGALLHGLGWGLCGLIGRHLPEPAHGAV